MIGHSGLEVRSADVVTKTPSTRAENTIAVLRKERVLELGTVCFPFRGKVDVQVEVEEMPEHGSQQN